MLHLVLAVAPLVLLVALLALGHYPGEDALDAARSRLEPTPPRRRRAGPTPVRTTPRRLLPRGGALLARRLAGRAPPFLATCHQTCSRTSRGTNKMIRKTLGAAAGAAAGAALLVPAVADAHVTLQPETGPAGGYVVEHVRVPNEDDTDATTKVVVQFPAGFEHVAHQPVPGWDIEVERKGEEVDTVTFSGGRIEPGEFQDFPLSLQLPEDAAGEDLTFKALQTYEGGEVVRWIGAPDADKPAAVVSVTEAEEDGHGASSGHSDDQASETTAAAPATDTSETAAAATDGGDGDDGGSDGLAIAALVVGGLGLALGAAGLVAARRSPATA